jgi:stage IV sporulation protein FA
MKRVEERLVLKKHIKKFLNKCLLSIIIFLIGMILVKSNSNFKSYITENIFEKNINFTKYKIIYEKYFGNILSLDKVVKEESVFNEKLSYIKKESYNEGVKLTVTTNYLVPNIESGVVVYIGEKSSLGNTIIIDQVDGIETIYSNIKESNVSLYDYVEKGNLLGEVEDNTLYLYFKKEGEYLNYKEYI